MNVWETLFSGVNGILLQSALQTLMMISAESIQTAIDNISRAESVGPYVDPSAWLDGAKFRNARDYKAVLNAVLALRRLLPDNTIADP